MKMILKHTRFHMAKQFIRISFKISYGSYKVYNYVLTLIQLSTERSLPLILRPWYEKNKRHRNHDISNCKITLTSFHHAHKKKRYKS